jgi:hypothetical protein
MKMDAPFYSWGSPVGIGIFFTGAGILAWGFLSGIAAVMKAKSSSKAPD